MSLGRFRLSLRRRLGSGSGRISVAIVALCTGVFLGLSALNSLHLVSREAALSLLGLSYDGVVGKLWVFQFVTAPLLHVSLTHVGFNMLTLWFLGPDVETALGRRRYLGLSVSAALCAQIGFLVMNSDARVIACGYSGVIFAILVAQAVLFPNRRVYIYAFFPLRMKYAALLLGAVEVYLMLTQSHGGIAHSGHVLGALAGWLYLRGMRFQAKRARQATPPRRLPSGSADRRAVHPENEARAPGASITGPIVLRGARDRAPRVSGHAASPVAPSLVVLTGTLLGRSFPLTVLPATVGRGPDNRIVVPGDPEVSRVHAEVQRDSAGRYWIIDRQSRNGLFVNGQRATRHLLAPGDRIRIGRTELEVMLSTHG